jgi:molybdopterin-guanine dinucleotide biosynthesis protein A
MQSTTISSVYHRPMEGPLNVSAAFILAGGKSSRMGADKAFLEFQGRTLLARALHLARSVTSEVSIVGSKEKFAPFAPVVEDVFQNCGPLGGIHAALQSSPAELNLMLAVDLPFLSEALLQYLIAEARHVPDAAVIIPRAGGRWQPLCAGYRRQFAAVAENALRAGRNKIDPLFAVVSTRALEEDELQRAGFSQELFRNLNTPAELQAARQDRKTASPQSHRDTEKTEKT